VTVAGSTRVRSAPNRSNALPAVWYFPSDYAGFWRRLGIELADATMIVVLLLVVTVSVALLDPMGEWNDSYLFAGWAALVWGYFVLLKRIRVGTVGYRLAGVHIVDAYGRPPGLGALTLRLAFGLLGPVNFLLDVLWIPSDRHKQSLRDKFAHTYVVKTGAQPAGPARVVHRTYYVMGMAFVFQDVEAVSVGGSGGR
jgi:uncharacterized RDD family membrane protein YckC